MTMGFQLGVLGLTVAASLAGCSLRPTAPPVTPEGTPGYSNISPAELAELLEQKDFYFVNTHVPYEGEIEATDAFLPFDQIEQDVGRLPADKDAKIVLYCRSGRMSAIAADTLLRLGFANVWNLEGGMIAWAEAGLPLLGR